MNKSRAFLQFVLGSIRIALVGSRLYYLWLAALLLLWLYPRVVWGGLWGFVFDDERLVAWHDGRRRGGAA